MRRTHGALRERRAAGRVHALRPNPRGPVRGRAARHRRPEAPLGPPRGRRRRPLPTLSFQQRRTLSQVVGRPHAAHAACSSIPFAAILKTLLSSGVALRPMVLPASMTIPYKSALCACFMHDWCQEAIKVAATLGGQACRHPQDDHGECPRTLRHMADTRNTRAQRPMRYRAQKTVQRVGWEAGMASEFVVAYH